ncbi:MAG: FAD/NAD(P)-binding protein [Anaerohalosphaera sp.]|nr:FAD/NAD(P)-binding protein [Anaerohalosphaera sp.]
MVSKGLSTSLPQPQKPLYEPFSCEVTAIKELTHTEKLFRLNRLDGLPFSHKPGQFVQVSIPGSGEAPISVSSSTTRGDYLELAVRKVGSLTAVMHQLNVGSKIGLRGPFGSSFDTKSMKNHDLLLISGGCGLAPMRSLIQFVEDRRDDFGRSTIFYGAKSPEDVMYKTELEDWANGDAFTCRVTVDNVSGGTCWDGQTGLITNLVEAADIDVGKTIAVIVGPPVMYKHVIVKLKDKGVSDDQIIVSLERYMKCGSGKCGHCTIEHLYCCIDGPVFRYDKIKELKGAL